MFRLILTFIYNLWRALLAPLWFAVRWFARPKSAWLHLRVRARLVEFAGPSSPLSRFVPEFAATRPTSLEAIRRLVSRVVADSRVTGLLIELPQLQAGWATCEALRDEVRRLRTSGKDVVLYLPQGAGNKELLIAAEASRVFVSPASQLSLLGLAARVPYFKEALDEVGVEVDVFRRSEYKTAAEPMTRTTMSEAQREQTNALLAGVDEELRRALRLLGSCDEAGVDELFSHALCSAKQALELGLVDGIAYEDEVFERVTSDVKLSDFTSAGGYLAWSEAKLFRPLRPKPYLALIEIQGAIRGGAPGTREGLAMAKVISSIRAAHTNPRVKGVLLFVNSPGGSALASDLIYREIRRLREAKPVVACFGDVAASGGYYIAAGADEIVARQLTVTGSIGVVSARLGMGALLSKLKIHVETIRLAPHADMLTRSDGLNEAEQAILEREVDAMYRTFLGVVAEGRGRSVEEIDALAGGRVWSGTDAHRHGLVDVLGGVDVALTSLRTRLADELSPAALERLTVERIKTRQFYLPPPTLSQEDRVAKALIRRLSPDLVAWWELLDTRERLFCYADRLPTIE